MSFTWICLSGQIHHTHYEPAATIKYLCQKPTTLVIDTLSLDLSIKTYTDAILYIKLIRRYRYL